MKIFLRWQRFTDEKIIALRDQLKWQSRQRKKTVQKALRGKATKAEFD